MAKLHPTASDTDDGYKERVIRPYAEFDEQIKSIHVLHDAPAPGVAKKAAKKPAPKS